MYLHLGQETTVCTAEIIGIFDMDTSSVSVKTREYLAAAQKAGQVVNVSAELPKSFVVQSSRQKPREKRREESQNAAEKKGRKGQEARPPGAGQRVKESGTGKGQRLYICPVNANTLKKRTGEYL